MYQNLDGDTQGKANEYDKEGITNEFQPPGADFIKLFIRNLHIFVLGKSVWPLQA